MTQVNFRIEEDVKNNAEKALKDMGLTMSAAITMFLVKVGREKRIPFEINADPFYSAENIAELERRVANLRNGSSVLKEHELIEVDDEAWEEYLYWQTQDKKTLKRINKLLTDIDRNGYNCIGKPEPLRENLSGYWSVRIDEQNRIVFKITGEQLEILQCGSHYRDK